MAPAIGALVGAGGVMAVRMYREPKGSGWLVLPGSIAVAAVWAWVLISRDTAWNGWLRYVVAGVAVAAIIALVLRKLRRSAIVLGLVAVLLAPGVWSAAGALASTGNATIPTAGPATGRDDGGFVLRLPPGVTEPPAGMVPPQGGIRGGGGFGGRDSGELTADQQKILAYATSHSAGAAIVMAVEGGSQAASPYIIATDETVIGMGGFGGRDPAPSVDQLSTWVHEGKLRFVLVGGRGGGGAPPGAGGTPPAAGGAPTTGGGGFGGMRGGDSTGRSAWIQQNCTSVLTAGQETLYECTDG
jgi:4-amino-4-deoxy-L-arabinose transferase-like glycosyltransferase